MRLIKTLVLLIAMIINSATPAGSLYMTYDGETVRTINAKEQAKYEKIIDLCENAAEKDYINTYEEKETDGNFKVYYVNKSYIVGHIWNGEDECIFIAKDEIIQKGIIRFEGNDYTYDIMEFLETKDVTGLNDLI